MNKVTDKTESLKQTLIYEISSGYYRVGTKLPSERVLCSKYKISRNTVRITLDQLEAQGIICRRERSGAIVTASNACNDHIAGPELKVAWILPPDQIANPLVMTIFNVFRQYCPESIKISVIFIDQLDSEEFKNLKADIAILFSVTGEAVRNRIKQRIPRVILLNMIDNEYDYVAPDNYLGGKIIAEYLVQQGHRKIGGVTFDDSAPGSDFNQRLKGCTDTLSQKGIPFELTTVSAIRFNDYRYRRKLITPAINADFTALVGGCDAIAAELCAAAYSIGKRIPHDISIIGFDDQLYSQFMLPPLTTVKYPAEAIGMHLASTIEERLKGAGSNIQKLIPPVLIERSSVFTIKQL